MKQEMQGTKRNSQALLSNILNLRLLLRLKDHPSCPNATLLDHLCWCMLAASRQHRPEATCAYSDWDDDDVAINFRVVKATIRNLRKACGPSAKA